MVGFCLLAAQAGRIYQPQYFEVSTPFAAIFKQGFKS